MNRNQLVVLGVVLVVAITTFSFIANLSNQNVETSQLKTNKNEKLHTALKLVSVAKQRLEEVKAENVRLNEQLQGLKENKHDEDDDEEESHGKAAAKEKDCPKTVSHSGLPLDNFDYYASEEYLLKLLQENADPEKRVMTNFAVLDYMVYAWDWAERLKDLGVPHRILLTSDVGTFHHVREQGVPVYLCRIPYSHFKYPNVRAHHHTMMMGLGIAKTYCLGEILRLGYHVFFSEMDVFWSVNPFSILKPASEGYELQISGHSGHQRTNVGLFYLHSTPNSVKWATELGEFFIQYAKPGFVFEQRILDAFLSNYDKFDQTYLRLWKAQGHPFPLPLKWTRLGHHGYHHFMTDGNSISLYQSAANSGFRSKKFFGGKFLTFSAPSTDWGVWSLQFRAATAIAKITNRALIWPKTMGNGWSPYRVVDPNLFMRYWPEPRAPNFLEIEHTRDIQGNRKSLWFGYCEPAKKPQHENLVCVDDKHGPSEQDVIDKLKAFEDVAVWHFDNIEFGNFNAELDTLQHDLNIRDSLSYCHPQYSRGKGNSYGFEVIGRFATNDLCVSDYRQSLILSDQIFECFDWNYKCNSRTRDHDWWPDRPWIKN